MTMIRPKISTLLLGVGVALAAASPALARNNARPGYDARAQAPAAAGEISPHRAQALRECNAASAKTLDYVWGDMQSDQLRACMAERGEVE
jgi:hypothetical protein